MVTQARGKSRGLFSLVAERALWRQGYRLVAGVDEVGRGAWAGPLVAAAVLIEEREAARLRRTAWWRLVADSKSLQPWRRQEIVRACRSVVRWAVVAVSSKVIDGIGVAAANRRAVHAAVAKLVQPPDFVLADYLPKLGEAVAHAPARALVRGDATVFSIALASILAKVERDRLMVAYAERYPGYGFAEHKGYGTRQHHALLERLGPSPIHRVTYRPVSQLVLH